MDDHEQLNPGHHSQRSVLRLLGPIIFAIGAIFMIVGMVSFFTAFGSFDPPRYFWCCFVGIPLMGVGAMMTGKGFLGAIFRYHAAEMAPVAKDATNYLAHGKQDAVRTTARAAAHGIAQGLKEGSAEPEKGHFCTQCGTRNDADAKFCKSCGRSVV